MTSLLTREDELILRSRIRRRHAIEEAMQELGYSTPGELGPDAEHDWHEGQEASRCFANYALPAIRKIACDIVDSYWDSDDAKAQEMNRAYAVAEALAWSNTNIPSFMDVVLNIVCPNTVYPYLRANIADVIQRSGFPPIHLAEINFEVLYQQRLAAAQQQDGAANQDSAAQLEKAENPSGTTH